MLKLPEHDSVIAEFVTIKQDTMKQLFATLLIAACVISCKHEDHLKWPKAKGVITGDGSNGRIGKGYSSHFDVAFTGADGKEHTGEYKFETTFTSKAVGDTVEFYYDPARHAQLFDEDTYNQMQRGN